MFRFFVYRGLGSGLQTLGFKFWSSGFGFRVSDFGVRVPRRNVGVEDHDCEGLGLRVTAPAAPRVHLFPGLVFRVPGFEFRVSGFGDKKFIRV